MKNANEEQKEAKAPMTAREITRMMIQKAAEKNGGKLGGKGAVDSRKFRRL